MRNRRFLSFGLALMLSLYSILAFNVPTAYAAAITWDGGGSDDNFSTAQNWAGDTAPTNGDSIIIPYSVAQVSSCTANVDLNNDLNPSSVTLAGISFTGSLPADCYSSVNITGNNLSVSGNISGNEASSSYPSAEFSVDITATSPIDIESIYSTGSLTIGSNNINLISAQFDGGVSGSGNLTISNHASTGSNVGYCNALPSPAPVSGDSSSYSGNITAGSYGSISITNRSSDIARHAGSVTKDSYSYLYFVTDNQQDMTFDKPITFNGGYAIATQAQDNDCNQPTSNKTVTLSGNIAFTAETTFYLYETNIHFAGTVTGKEFIKVPEGQTGKITFADGSEIASGQKVWTIDNTADCNSFSAGGNNKTLFNVDCSSSVGADPQYPSEFSGILGGTGKVGHIKIMSGGVIAPGLSPGCLGTGNLTLVSGSTYDFEVGGIAECTDYDQINVAGTVDLGNGTLNTILFNGFQPQAGQNYKIINNDGADAVTGTFNNLPQGATFTVNGYVFGVSYTGGDGNDVVLNVVSVPGTPDTGFKLMQSNPLITFIATTLVAGGIFEIARRYNKLSSKQK